MFARLGSCLNPCFSGTYSQRTGKLFFTYGAKVLILVLVEHTLRGNLVRFNHYARRVLILVLVEHTLRVNLTRSCSQMGLMVLILVLVEHTLRDTGRAGSCN